MATLSYRYGFSCEVRTFNGTLNYGDYCISKGTTSKSLDVDPPPIFRNVIFDILQEYTFYGGKLIIDHTIAYLHLDGGEEKQDLVCLDVAILEPEHKIDTKRPIVPAKYNLFPGYKIGNTTYFFGDIYNSVIHGDWNTSQPLQLIKRTAKNSHWSQFAGFVDLKFSVTREADLFRFEGEFVVRRHLLGEICGLAPIPQFPGNDELPRHAVVVGEWLRGTGKEKDKLGLSASAFSNLRELGRLLEYRGSQTVWVKGDPGSGKEVFAQALHAGSVVSRGKPLRTRSVAGAKLTEFNQRLFSAQSGETCLIEQVDGGGTLFLDEFDKVDPDHTKAICSTLLRVLEANEYIRESLDNSGRRSETAAKINEVNWIFAGAFSTSDSSSIPKDFWSRLTGLLTIRHPVLGSRRYAATLFMYFYVAEAIRGLGPRHGVYIENFVRLLETPRNKRKFNEEITARILGEGESFVDPDHRVVPSQLLVDLVFEFAKLISVGENDNDGKLDGTQPDSSRGIRQAAKAAFFTMRQLAIEEGDSFTFEAAAKSALKAAGEMLVTSRGESVFGVFGEDHGE